MYPRLIVWLQDHWGPDVPLWWVPDQSTLVGLGFMFAAIASLLLAKRDGLEVRHVALGLAGSIICALLGARLLALLIDLDEVIDDPTVVFDMRRSGAVSFGALVGGALAFAGYARAHRLDVWRYADTLVPVAGLGLAFARLGCFMHGCDFGRITSLPWGLRFPAPAPAFRAQFKEGFVGPYQIHSLPVHPTQLLLAMLGLVIAVVFWRTPQHQRLRVGQRALLAGALYFAGRFVIEFTRSPFAAPQLGALNLAQWFCVVGLLSIEGLRRWHLSRHSPCDPEPGSGV